MLVWNCQGVTRASFKGNLIHLLKAHKPDIVVLLETRTSNELMRSVLRVPYCHKLDTLRPSHIFGGMAILSITKGIEFVRSYGGLDKMVGSIKGIATC